MRFAKGWLILALAAAVPMGGCRDDPPSSLHPVFTDEALERPSGVEGRWEDGDATLVISAWEDGGAYTLEVTDANKPATYLICFGRVGNELFWDLTAEPGRTGVGALPVHLPARVRLEGDTLEVAFVDGRYLAEALEKGELSVAHSIVDDAVLLTATAAEVEEFLAANAWREDLFGKPSRFWRR